MGVDRPRRTFCYFRCYFRPGRGPEYKKSAISRGFWKWCRWRDSNPHAFWATDFESIASAISPHRHLLEGGECPCYSSYGKSNLREIFEVPLAFGALTFGEGADWELGLDRSEITPQSKVNRGLLGFQILLRSETKISAQPDHIDCLDLMRRASVSTVSSLACLGFTARQRPRRMSRTESKRTRARERCRSSAIF